MGRNGPIYGPIWANGPRLYFNLWRVQGRQPEVSTTSRSQVMGPRLTKAHWGSLRNDTCFVGKSRSGSSNLASEFKSAEPNTYRPTQKLKIWVWVGFETTKLSLSQSSLLLAYSFYIHFLPSTRPSFFPCSLTDLLTYNYLHD